jgi:branched-chain amino acid transport system substrate-binding protein
MVCRNLFMVSMAALQFLAAAPAESQDTRPFRIGVVTFLSGPGAAPFGIPARNSADFLVESLNSGAVPNPYQIRGFGGRPLEMVLVDEAGPVTKVVTEYRSLVERREVDLVVGYLSSGACLAVAPVAEELKRLTVFFTCGTSRLFEEAAYRYVFRTASHSASDSVGAALYVHEQFPAASRVAGINPNYAWGQDSWRDFEAAMKQLAPGSKVVTSQMPKLFAGQYGAEISALAQSEAEVIHSSLWGGDLDAFLLQAVPRGVFRSSHFIFTTGETVFDQAAIRIPDGTVVGARGPHGVFAPDTQLNRWFRSGYERRYNAAPVFPAYHMAQAILGAKAAYERAQAANGGMDPDQERVIRMFRGLKFETPSGITHMALADGHQGVQGMAYGTTRLVDGKVTIIDVRRYSAEQVNPPEGMKSDDWIRTALRRR